MTTAAPNSRWLLAGAVVERPGLVPMPHPIQGVASHREAERHSDALSTGYRTTSRLAAILLGHHRERYVRQNKPAGAHPRCIFRHTRALAAPYTG